MKYFLILACVGLVYTAAFSQTNSKITVPDAVKLKFSKLYPNTGSPKWEVEDGIYEASFKQNSVESSVLFSSDGSVIQTETEISPSLLPQSIKDYVHSKLPGKTIASASKIVDARSSITYEAEVDKTDYLFDANGNFIQKVDTEEGEEDDDDD